MTALAERRDADRRRAASSTSRSSSPSSTRRTTSSRACAGCTRSCDADFPFSAVDHHRRQRQHRRHLGASPRAARPSCAGVRAVHLDAKGRGRALHQVWSPARPGSSPTWTSTSRPTSNALLPLVAPLLSRAQRRRDRHAGWRGRRGSCAARSASSSPAATTCCCARRCGPGSPTRSAASRRCGPSARGRCCRSSQDPAWFFDTELLVLAERSGLRIAEVPVDWVDDPDSRVDIVATAMADLRGIARVGRALVRGDLPLRELRAAARPRRACRRCPACRRGCAGQALRFGVDRRAQHARLPAAVRAAPRGRSARRRPTSSRCWSPPSPTPRPTAASPSACAAAGAGRHQLQGLVVFGLGLGAHQRVAAPLLARSPRTPAGCSRSACSSRANLVATVLRFVLLRDWVFGRRADRPPVDQETSR